MEVDSQGAFYFDAPPQRPPLSPRSAFQQSIEHLIDENMPHCTQAMRAAICTEMAGIPQEHIDMTSCREVRHQLDPTLQLKQVCILDESGQPCIERVILHHDEACFVHRVLPDGSGVEMSEMYSFEHRVASAQQIAGLQEASHQKYRADLGHCQKLLRDLPVALRNSQSAGQALACALVGGGNGDLSELGARKDRVIMIRVPPPTAVHQCQTGHAVETVYKHRQRLPTTCLHGASSTSIRIDPLQTALNLCILIASYSSASCLS